MSASSLRIGRSEMHWRPWEAPAAVFLVEGALIFDTLTPQVLSVTVGYVGLARDTCPAEGRACPRNAGDAVNHRWALDFDF